MHVLHFLSRFIHKIFKQAVKTVVFLWRLLHVRLNEVVEWLLRVYATWGLRDCMRFVWMVCHAHINSSVVILHLTSHHCLFCEDKRSSAEDHSEWLHLHLLHHVYWHHTLPYSPETSGPRDTDELHLNGTWHTQTYCTHTCTCLKTSCCLVLTLESLKNIAFHP